MKTIFIVEDDPSIRDSLQFVLELEGYKVASSRNGQEALDALLSKSVVPDLILLDIMMPVMDGIRFREEQLKYPELSKLPTIVLSADRNFHRSDLKTSFSGVFPKPLDLELLLNFIVSLIPH